MPNASRLLMQYYIMIHNRACGPMTAAQVMAYPVNADTPVSREGSDWAPLFTYPELMEAYRYANRQSDTNRRILCGIMAILFGTLGVQYFILGKVSAGLLTILLSIITCGAWSVIVLIQGIMMLCMSDAEFEQKYVTTSKSFPLF